MFLFVTLCSVVAISLVYKSICRTNYHISFEFSHVPLYGIHLVNMGILIFAPQMFLLDELRKQQEMDISREQHRINYSIVLRELLERPPPPPALPALPAESSTSSLESIALDDTLQMVSDAHKMSEHPIPLEWNINRNRSHTFPIPFAPESSSESESDDSEDIHNEYVFVDFETRSITRKKPIMQTSPKSLRNRLFSV